MKTYELTYIISPEVSSEEAESFSKEIESFISQREGSVTNRTNPVAKTLSYQIKKHASGFIGSLEFHLDPEKMAELKEMLTKDGKVSRHMIITKNPARIEKVRGKRSRLFKDSLAAKETPAENKIAEEQITPEPTPASKKVELKDIEDKLEEILGE